MKIFHGLLFGLSLLAATPHLALASYREYGTNVVVSPLWPSGLADIVNSPARVSGHSLNGTSEFQFLGDAKVLNGFLQIYAAVPGIAHIVYLVPATGNPFYSSDCELQILSYEGVSATLKVFVNERVKLSELKVPKSVALEVFPAIYQPVHPTDAQKHLTEEVDAQVKAFVAERQRQASVR